MDINKLRTFVDLAETLSFSKTAVNLFITQSSVSKHIKFLEKELGHPLFIRTNRNVSLSNYGKCILPYVQRILIENDAMLEQVNKLSEKENEKLILGVIPTFSSYDAFKNVAGFKKKYPKIQIDLKECESMEIPTLLDQGTIDIAFARIMKNDNTNNKEKIVTKKENFTACLSSDDPLSRRKILSLKELREKTFVMLAKDSMLYDPVISLCKRVNFEPKIGFTSDRISSIIEFIVENHDVALLMNSSAKDPRVRFVKVQPTMSSKLSFLKNKKNNSIAVKTFWKYMFEIYYSKGE